MHSKVMVYINMSSHFPVVLWQLMLEGFARVQVSADVEKATQVLTVLVVSTLCHILVYYNHKTNSSF